MFKFFVITTIFYTSIVHNISAQEYSGTNTFPIYQSSFTKVGSDVWAAGGANIATPSRLAYSYNPACLASGKTSVYIEFGKNQAAEWLYDIDWDSNFLIPSNFSITIPYKKSILSLGYYDFYNYQAKFQIVVTQLPNPDEPIGPNNRPYAEYKNVASKRNIHSFYGAMNYKFTNSFSFGTTISFNYLKAQDSIEDNSADGNGKGVSLILGGLFQFSDHLSLGAAFKFTKDIQYTEKWNTGITNTELTEFPWSVAAGIEYSLFKDFLITFMLDYQNWSHLSGNFSNSVNIHIGTGYNVLNIFTVYFGYFTQNEPNEEFANVLDQQFLTVGFSKKFNSKIKFNVSVLDSHLFENSAFKKRFGNRKQFHQSYISTGLSYSM